MPGLRGARVFDGLGLVEEAVVVIDGSTIVGLERRVVEIDVIDLGDVPWCPALVDCHQHLCFDGNGTLEEQVAGIDDAALSVRARTAASRRRRARSARRPFADTAAPTAVAGVRRAGSRVTA